LAALDLQGARAVVWDLPGGRQKTYSLAGLSGRVGRFSRPAFLADGRLLVVEHQSRWLGKDIRLVVRDFVSGGAVGPGVATTHSGATLFLGIQPVDGHLSADGRWLAGIPKAVGGSRDPITIWEVQSGKQAGQLSLPGRALGIQGLDLAGLSPDGKWLYHLCNPSDAPENTDLLQIRVRVLDFANRRHYWDVPFSGDFLKVRFSPDGRLLAVGYENGPAEVWDVQERELLFQWRPLGVRSVQHLAFSSDGAFLAASGDAGPIHLLNLAELRRQLAQAGLEW
jgi:WD40 repeat protein